MSVETPGIFIQSGGETAERARRALAAILGRRGGIVDTPDLAVTENGTPNMTVNVASGQVVIPGTQATYQGSYILENRGALNVALAAADATNPRKDLIVAKVQDAAYSGASNIFSIVAVTGTPAASPAEPAMPANAWQLALVDIPANDTAITNSQITDRRTQQTGQKGNAAALGGVIVCTSATLPTAPEGTAIYVTDLDEFYVSDGVQYSVPDNLASGIMQKATLTTSVGPTSAATEMDIITAPSFQPSAGNRKIRITLNARGVSNTVANEVYILKIKEGATILAESHSINPTTSVDGGVFPVIAYVDSPSQTGHVYKATIQRTSGTGTATVSATTTGPITLVVEDCGGI